MSFFLLGCQNNSVSEGENEVKRPNIILIMADDLGYNDLGCYGSQRIKSPNIDELAAKGIQFTDYHSNGVVCSPTRAALLTGKYQQRTGIEGVITAKNHRHTGLGKDHLTMAEYLKTHGYQTGIFGKWHLGYDTTYSPLNHGFDIFRGFVSGNVDYHSHIDQTGHYDWWFGKDTIIEKGYTTDLITKHSVSFIKNNQENPFFLYIAHEAPHSPYQGRNDTAERTVDGEFVIQGAREDRAVAYQEMIWAMDEGIGKIISCLDNNNLLEETFIFFCSDNGANKVGSNDPLRGYKGQVWEGGHRVPAIAYWKNHTYSGKNNQPVMSMDIYPTIVDLMGDNKSLHLKSDGHSFLPLLRDKDAEMIDRRLFWRFGDNKKAARFKQWKYVKLNQQEYLFNLAIDLEEENNLMDSLPEKADDLKTSLADWEEKMSSYKIRTN